MKPTGDPFDDLATLFLTDADECRYTMPDEARPTFVDVVLVGNLPVRAGLWLPPYADWCARSVGPTALVRLDRETPTIEVMRGGPIARDLREHEHESGATLGACIDGLANEVGYWIVRPRLDDDSAAVIAADPDRVTVLTGADEAAIVQAYRLIKRLAEAAGATDHELPPVSIVVMGSDAAVAARAVEALNETTRSYLGLEVTFLASIPRMDVAPPATLVMHCDGGSDDTVANVGQRLFRHGGAAQPMDVPSPATKIAAAPMPMDRPERREAPVVEIPRRPAPSATTDGPPAPIGDRVRVESFKLSPKVARTVEPKAPGVAREPDLNGAPVALSAHVDGLSALALRCPGRERVEIAVDDAGRPHLLCWQADLEAMHYVSTWVRTHAEIIRMACPDRPFDGSQAVTRHVFTSTPREVASLHGADLRLYVLAPVRVGTSVAWYAAPLNEPGLVVA